MSGAYTPISAATLQYSCNRKSVSIVLPLEMQKIHSSKPPEHTRTPAPAQQRLNLQDVRRDIARIMIDPNHDDGSYAPSAGINAYIESSQIDIGDGDQFAFIKRMIPDITFRKPFDLEMTW